MLLLVCTMLALLSCGLAHDYHYPRPQTPFHLSPQPQRPVREPVTKFIVQTLGPHGRTYELQTQKAPAIYVAHQTVHVPQQQQLQQYQQQQQQHQQHYGQQQLQTSAFKNPLLVNTNYQPLPPPAPPINYYGHGHGHGQGQGQGQGQIQSHAQQPVDSYYNAPQALTVATATHVQPATHYGPPQLQLQVQSQQQQQQQQQQQPHDSNPQPYAIVTLPSGQRVQDAGHGSGPTPTTGGNSNQPARLGDYNAQSQSATLDTYSYKQTLPGDARSYQRFVTKCQPNGQCQQLTLNPGQIDADHQQLLHAARAQTQPASTGCKKQQNEYVPPGAQRNDQGQVRPRGRRTYAHVQEQLAKYPYN
ncbi:hypothetical protein ACLKA6_016584 [Drosophila palustris]